MADHVENIILEPLGAIRSDVGNIKRKGDATLLFHDCG